MTANEQNINQSSYKQKSYFTLFIVIGFILAINLLLSFVNYKWDLTEEKRFTLTPATKAMLNDLNDAIYVEVLLEGEFPAGFRRLQEATKDMLDQFRSETPNIQYRFIDPLDVPTADEKNERIKTLAEQGIKPTNLRVSDGTETSQKIIYPVALIKYGSHVMPVNLLENEVAGFGDEEVLNLSVNLLEYKLADAVNKIFRTTKPVIGITIGHGESRPIETQDLINTLAPYYDIRRINPDSMYKVPDEIKLVIVPNPQVPFSEKAKFVLDQFVMRGGNMIFAINRLKIDMDSLRNPRADYVPIENDVNLEDMFFKYGFRIQPNLILDMECTRIPLVVGQLGTGVQTDLFKWYYAPLLTSANDHPIVKNIDRVNVYWPSTIDTIKTKTDIKKTYLLTSSQYTRLQFAPVRVNFEILRYDPEPDKFNKGKQPVALLLEGSFPSLYENRVPSDMLQTLKQINAEYKPIGAPSKIMVISYGKLLQNIYNPNSDDYLPIGYNTFEKTLFGNKDFLMNTIEYMFDEKGILAARSKEVKLRMLDLVKVKKEKTFWQMVNVVGPLALLGLGTFVFNWNRKRKYARLSHVKS